MTRSVPTLLILSLLAPGILAAQEDPDIARQRARQEAERAREESRRAREQARRERDLMREQMKQAQQEIRQNAHQMQRLLREQRKMSLYPMLGVWVKTDSENRDGVLVDRVTPGGPAEKAGILKGDVLLAIKGQRLIESSDAGLESAAHSVAKLLTLVHGSHKGEKFPVQYRRGKETRQAEVMLEQWGGADHSAWQTEMSALKELHFPAHWQGLELVGMNAELGEYFGTDHGLLVLRGARETKLKLKSGDVILKIGEQPAESPMQAVRILRSFDPGKPVTLEILRHKQPQKVTLQLPDRDSE